MLALASSHSLHIQKSIGLTFSSRWKRSRNKFSVWTARTFGRIFNSRSSRSSLFRRKSSPETRILGTGICPLQSFVVARLDTVERRRYDAANLYIVLDRIVKPHI